MYHSKKLHKENMENFGSLHTETTFDSLFKFQHYTYVENLLQDIKQESPNDYKPFLLKKL